MVGVGVAMGQPVYKEAAGRVKVGTRRDRGCLVVVFINAVLNSVLDSEIRGFKNIEPLNRSLKFTL